MAKNKQDETVIETAIEPVAQTTATGSVGSIDPLLMSDEQREAYYIARHYELTGTTPGDTQNNG